MENQRIDKWLWVARFYKTRPLATEAVNGGRVHLNGDRVKPSKNIQVGDHLSITKGQYEFELSILKLNKQRRPAVEAQTLYAETKPSIEKREALIESMKILNASQPHSDKRPNKKQRREITKIKRADG